MGVARVRIIYPTNSNTSRRNIGNPSRWNRYSAAAKTVSAIQTVSVYTKEKAVADVTAYATA